MSNIVWGHDLLHHRVGAGAILAFRLGKFLFEVWDHAVGEFACPLEFTLALRDLQFVACFVELLLEVCRPAELLLLRLPACRQCRRLFFERGQVEFELGKAIPGGYVGLLLQGFAFDLELNDAPVQLVEFLRFGVDLHPQT